LRQNNGQFHRPVQAFSYRDARTTPLFREKTMKFRFGRREKFLYRRNPMVASFLSGARFGLVLALLVFLAVTLA
jgi:hypothetical protein